MLKAVLVRHLSLVLGGADSAVPSVPVAATFETTGTEITGCELRITNDEGRMAPRFSV
jgi:hypothetical protein